MPEMRISKIIWSILVLIFTLFLNIPVKAQSFKADVFEQSARKNQYIFLPEQSTLVQTGGIAGVHYSYAIEGQFQITVDFDANTASFDWVDANAIDDSPYQRTLDPNDVFAMTELIGTIVDDAALKFIGQAADGSDVFITATFQKNFVHLAGETIPPPNSADFFIFTLDAIAKRKYAGGIGEPNNPFLIYTAEQMNTIGTEPNDWDKHFKLMADIDLSSYLYDAALIAPDIDPSDLSFIGASFTGVLDGNCHTISNLTITGETYLGLFGRLESGAEIKNLGIIDVNITGNDYLGGLVAFSNGSITASYCTGMVTGDRFIGGLTGRNWFSITSCFNTATVSGHDDVGGIAGGNYGSIMDSYNSGMVNSYRDAGGLVGANSGVISSSYSTGMISGENSAGGLIGNNWSEASVTSSFWDVESSLMVDGVGNMDPDPNGVVGKTTAEMHTRSTFTDAGWDFVGEEVNGPNDIWKMWDGYDYPRLIWEPGPITPLVFVDINDPGFYGHISKYEVTNAQYCDFLNAALASGDIIVNDNIIEGASGLNSGADYVGESYYNVDGSGYTGYGATNGGAARVHYSEGAFNVDNNFGNHPVTYVSWYGAMAFANYYGYYLPTEEQWQAVADYDGTYIYGCGETIDTDIANYRYSDHPDGTTAVGSFGIYGYGMSDLAGNVWEWTNSSLDDSRIFRGGSMGSLDSDCAVSIRGDGIPYANYWDIGFRICR